MDTIKRGPVSLGRTAGPGVLDNQRGNYTDHTRARKLPPYAKHLTPSRQSVVILTGAGAWDRAQSQCWFDGCKLVLPIGDDPAAYRWPVSGRDCIVYSFGDREQRERLIRLSVELVRARATFVIWCTDFADLDELTDEELFRLPQATSPEPFFPGLQARRAA